MSDQLDGPLSVAVVGTRGVPASYGGFETCAEELSVRMAAHGHHVTVYCRVGNWPGDPSSYKGVALEYVRFVDRKALSTLTHTGLSLARALRRHHDVFLVFNAGNAVLLPPLRALGRKLVVNVDGLEWKRGKWGPWAKRFYRGSEWLASRAAQRIVADARAIGDYYESQWGAPSTFIPYGGHITKPEHPALLDEYGLSPGGYVLMASRLEPENNAAVLVEAWKGVRTDKALVIVGSANWDSPYVRRLEAEADGRTRFLGGVYRPGHYNELVCGAYAFVHGNEVGGTNPGLLTALRSGTCVLALDVAFNREVAGDGALYFGQDADQLTALLQQVIDDPESCERMGARGRQRLEGRYDWDVVAARYEQLLQDVRAGRVDRRTPRD